MPDDPEKEKPADLLADLAKTIQNLGEPDPADKASSTGEDFVESMGENSAIDNESK